MRKKYALLGLALMLGSLSLKAQNPSKFIDRANMNLSVKPGDDFVTYSNGNWVKNNPIPAKETRWGSFNQLRDFNINAVKTILESTQGTKALAGSVEKRVADFYAAAMDSLAIEKLGFTPIQSDLNQIRSLQFK